MVVMQYEIPWETIQTVIDMAAEMGIPVLWNVAPAREFDRTYVSRVKWLVLNEVEAGFLSGMSVQDLNSHCCGMAGSWGLTADHYDLSRKIGSEMIAGLNNSDSVAGVTDCPTCRMQMEHLSDKDIMHPIEVVAKCLAF